MIKKIDYYYTEKIEIIDNNIGKNGDNLSIVILTYNKSALTIRLLDSIAKHLKNFKGEILIFDNNSDLEEKNNLRQYLKKYTLKYRLYCSKKNLGIGNGRKKAFSLVNKKWILSLDNDMYFIDSPIKELNNCIDKTGARFINLPAYNGSTKKKFINGGKFKIVKNNTLYITADTFNKKMPSDIYLSNFVFGGSSLINKYSYDLIGGYDKNFYVGYEDVDLSIRIYQAGIKIANINKFCLIHDHKLLKDNLSKMYERKRYNYKLLNKSANYFYKKYNYKYSVLSEGEKNFIKKINKDLGN